MDDVASLIALSKVSFGYDEGRSVLKDLDFLLAPGERVGITGPNGSGKSTLFYLVMGLLRPAGGGIHICGRAMGSEGDFAWARRRVGFLFQDADDQLFCPTVEEDVAFGPRNLGKSREESLTVVARTLESLGISHLSRRITHRLSGGEKRLVALAAVLAMEPEVLLLDEPSQGLDDATRAVLVRVLADLPAARAVISHDSSFLGETCDRVVRMEEGRIVE